MTMSLKRFFVDTEYLLCNRLLFISASGRYFSFEINASPVDYNKIDLIYSILAISFEVILIGWVYLLTHFCERPSYFAFLIDDKGSRVGGRSSEKFK